MKTYTDHISVLEHVGYIGISYNGYPRLFEGGCAFAAHYEDLSDEFSDGGSWHRCSKCKQLL
jgi:hypothetical protein